MLQAELDALRANTPAYVLRVSDPVPAQLLVDDQGELHFPTGKEGPWDVHVLLRPGALVGDQAAGMDDLLPPLRLRLRFGASWPEEPPEVCLGSMWSVPLLTRGRHLPQLFYDKLARDARGPLQLAPLLELVRSFVESPLAFLGEAADEVAVRRLRSWSADVRRLNAKRVDVPQKYVPSRQHPDIFAPAMSFKADWLDPGFAEAARANSLAAWTGLLTEHVPGQVYSFPLFSEHFCEALLEEFFSFHGTGLPARRPNSMNNYGIILDEIGLEPFVEGLQRLLQPLGHLFFPGPGSDWDGHHCFTVRYREGEDLGLDMHTDDSDVTFNVCLGLQFSGAGLQFCGEMGEPSHRHHSFTYMHCKGRCVMHLGRKRHGADDIQSGERVNLILWNHSSSFRRSRQYRQPPYYQEAGAPDPVCVSYTHDRDYGSFKPYPEGKERFRGKGWCPPPQAEYRGFKPDSTPGSTSADVASRL